MNNLNKIESSVAHRYACDIRSGKLPSGRHLQMCVDRYFDWLASADDDGYYFDTDSAERVIKFFPAFLNHTKGKLAGQPFHLAPFQQFTLYNLFGWKSKATGLRRIRTVYDKRAKKNGKTAEMAGLALYVMALDGEMSAEVYVGATKMDQAKLCWDQAKSFIEHPVSNQTLKKVGFVCQQNKIQFPETGAIMKPLEKSAETQDGINSHLAIIDEYHAHKDDGVKENLESSSVNRTQPITYHITTAGSMIGSVCFEYEQDVCLEVLKGAKKDNALWIMMHDIDADDDWHDESCWHKANPLLGQGLSIDGIRTEYVKAKNQPSKVPNFKTKHLNKWVSSMDSFIDDDYWMQEDNCLPPRYDRFAIAGCNAGLDLSTVKDLTACAFVSLPDDEGVVDLDVLLFCPEDTIDRRASEDGVPYKSWQLQGYLIATPGNIVDYRVVEDQVYSRYTKYATRWIDYDRFNSSSIVTNLISRGIKMHPFSQVISHFSTPTKEFESLVIQGKIRHGGNPALRWMLGGCKTIEDPNENIRIDKARSTRRVDGIVATVMALAGTLTPDPESDNLYESADDIVF